MKAEFLLTANDAQFQSAMDRAADRLTRVNSLGKTTSGGMKELFGQLGPMALSAAGGFSAASLAASAFRDAMDMEDALTSFRVLLGSQERAQQLFQELKAFAASTPFEFPEIASSAKSLLAFGFAAEDMQDTLRRVGDVASGVGQPLNEIAVIYGKARVQGRLFAEDINQLTERGIPIIGELAKQFGVAEGDVKKMVESGKVGFDNLEQAFVSLTSEGGRFFQMMDERSKTTSGQLSTLADAWRDVKVAFASEFLPAFVTGMQGVSSLIEGTSAALERWKTAFRAFGAFTGTEGGLKDKVDAYQDEINRAIQNSVKPKAMPEEIKVESEAAKRLREFEENAKKLEEAAKDVKKKKEKKKYKAGLITEESDEGKSDNAAIERMMLDVYKRQKDAITEAAKIEIEAKEMSLRLAEQQTEQAVNQRKIVSGMLDEMRIVAGFMGRTDLQAAERNVRNLMEQAGLGRQDAEVLDRGNRALNAANEKASQSARNIRDAEREQRRLEREGKLMAQAERLRKRAEEDEAFAKRGIKTVGGKGEALLDKQAEIQRKKDQEVQDARQREQDLKDELAKAQADRDKNLADIKTATQATADRLKLITSK